MIVISIEEKNKHFDFIVHFFSFSLAYCFFVGGVFGEGDTAST